MTRISTLSRHKKQRLFNRVAKKEVFDFKETYCNENEIITGLINKEIQHYFKAPILDVGAGIGDIAFKSFKGKKTYLIDVNAISKHDYPCRPEHIRRKVDFFEFYTKEKINTLFVGHTLQFIDDDVDKLNEKILELNPEYYITVLNSNNDFMGDLITWTKANCNEYNPEERIKNVPKGYNLIKSVPFSSNITCPDYKTLGIQISYLMLFNFEVVAEKLINYLKDKLHKPTYNFNQTIDIYHRI